MWFFSHKPDPDDPYIQDYVVAFEPLIINQLINQELARRNAILVKPILIRYTDTTGRIPVTFKVRGHKEPRIRHNHAHDHHGSHQHWLEVATDTGCWFDLSDEDMVRLYEALLEGGFLANIIK